MHRIDYAYVAHTLYSRSRWGTFLSASAAVLLQHTASTQSQPLPSTPKNIADHPCEGNLYIETSADTQR